MVINTKRMCNESLQFTKRFILPFFFHPEVASKGKIVKKAQRSILTTAAKNPKERFLS